MLMTRLLPALAVIAAVGGGSALVANATTVTPMPAPVIVQIAPAPTLTNAERAQMAQEAGISPKHAEGLTLGQLAWLKARRDSDDGAWFAAPAHINPAEVHS
jgi:hypothetical protein